MALDRHNEHPDEETLVLLFYGDTGPDEERELTAHLDSCAACEPVWHQIRTTLAAVDAAAVPEPPADFERVMWARVQGELETMSIAPTPWWSLRHLLPAGALAAVLLAMFAIGRYWPSEQAAAPNGEQVVSTKAAASQSERALLVAMDDHLERSELLLVELMNSPADDAVLGFERETADDLLSSGRLYRQTATHTGNVYLAAMLEDLEAVLVEIARSPQTLKAREMNALRTRIEEDDLLFKVRVVTDEVRERQKTISTVSEGDR